MAKEELRVAGILSVCTMAAIAGVVWGQVITPPTPPQELANEAENDSNMAEELNNIGEQILNEEENSELEEKAREFEDRARERENEIPAGS